MKPHNLHPTITGIFLLFFLIFSTSACQVAVSPAATATAAAVPTGTPPAAPTFAIPAPTVSLPASTPSTTPSPEPSATATAAPTQAALAAGGPWLLYQRQVEHPMGGFDEELFVMNQDGSSSQVLNASECKNRPAISIVEDPANRLVALGNQFVLVNLERAAAQYISPDCKTRYTGNAAGGLLAMIERSADAAELRVYALPEGTLRSAFPLPQCSRPGQSCGFDTDSGNWVAQWDGSQRYLAFPVNLDETRSDLYLYDAQTGATRSLGSVTGRVSWISWSPGETNLLLGVSPGGDIFLESFWAAPVAGGKPQRVSKEEFLGDVQLLDWVDENRFLYYRGSLQYVVTTGAASLRMLDIRSGKDTLLLGDGFLRAGLDRETGVVGMIVAMYNGQYEDGVYLVPVAKPTPQKIAPLDTNGIYNTYWDVSLGRFVSEDPCPDGGQGFRAFDSKGNWQCAPGFEPTAPPRVVEAASPDGQWRVRMQDGLWVEKAGSAAVKLQEATPTQVIWRPDSGGFFFLANAGLYYAAPPGISVQALDRPEELEGGRRWRSSRVEYMWIWR